MYKTKNILISIKYECYSMNPVYTRNRHIKKKEWTTITNDILSSLGDSHNLQHGICQ